MIPPTSDQYRDLEKLETSLEETKAAPEFRDRRDLEITADPGVTYRDLLDVWGMSVHAGWTSPLLSR